MGQGKFESDLEALINKHSKENGSDTPDYILAHYLLCCLTVFDNAVNTRTSDKNIRMLGE